MKFDFYEIRGKQVNVVKRDHVFGARVFSIIMLLLDILNLARVILSETFRSERK